MYGPANLADYMSVSACSLHVTTCSQQGLLDQTGLVIRHVTNAARSIRPMRHTVGQSMYGKISSSLLVHYSVCVIFLLWPVVFFHWQGSHV